MKRKEKILENEGSGGKEGKRDEAKGALMNRRRGQLQVASQVHGTEETVAPGHCRRVKFAGHAHFRRNSENSNFHV